MQEVYNDGTGGEIIPMDESALTEALKKKEVDHFEVFQLGSEAHKRAVERISDPAARKKARRKLRRIIAKKK